MDPFERHEAHRKERAAVEDADLAAAVAKGMVPPSVGSKGVYYEPGMKPCSFEVVRVAGMICYCRYAWQPKGDDPSCFIWGSLKEGEYNRFHTWPGRSDWPSDQ